MSGVKDFRNCCKRLPPGLGGGGVYKCKGSRLNLNDLLYMYVLIAISSCVLCQFKVCCDVHRRRNRDSNFYNNYTKINDLMLNCLPVVIYVIL